MRSVDVGKGRWEMAGLAQRLSAMLHGVFITQQDELCTSVADGEQYFKPCDGENNNDNTSNEQI